GILTAMQSLKDTEDLFVVLRIDADAVVPKRKEPRIVLFFRGNVDVRLLVAVILDGIADQVLKHTAQLREIRGYLWQRIAGDLGLTLADAAVQVHQHAG